MKLTMFTDYSLRSLIYVAMNQGAMVTVDDIARTNQISRHHVTKVISRLNQLGYLETVRGKGGGMRLAMRPELIAIGRVVRQTEADLSLVECINGKNEACVIVPACRLKSALDIALDAFFATLDRYTLADLLEPRNKLAHLLSVPIGKQARQVARKLGVIGANLVPLLLPLLAS